MEQVILVDEQDNEIGLEEKLKAHLEGRLHRAISVFVFNPKGQLLLQQRALSKYHSGGLWTNTVCSHQRHGEGSVEAAKRRLQEELGFTCEVKEIFSFVYKAKLDKGITEHEYDHVLVGLSDQEPVPNNEEVANYKWVDPSTLSGEFQQHPELYTYWFKEVWERVYSQIRQKT